jgi:hypothetical protein
LEILAIYGKTSALDRARCAALLELLYRCARLEGRSGEPEAEAPPPLGPALLDLAGKGRLWLEPRGEEVDVFYIPSHAASLGVAEAAEAAGFPEPVRKKQSEALRSSQGALLRFPLEHGDGPPLAVFITDWSPCPVAAAVAVHRQHPFVAGLGDLNEPRSGAFFTGRFVRHPLTGDLLPVWVADWVRPDFGTGAVLVNPAHDATDLEFGRAVGLPIRFGLVPEGFDGTPATWPAPPVLKTGRSLKTGFWDGLTPQEAMEQYFSELERRGLAERYRDIQAGRWRIARLVPDPAGDLAWNAARFLLLPDGAPQPVRVEDAELLTAALALRDGAAVSLVCPVAEQAGALLFLRLLAADLHSTPAAPLRLLLAHKVQEGKTALSPEAERLALLVGAPLQQVSVIKQQVIDQIQRFLRLHGELHQTWTAGAGAPAAALPRTLQQAKAALLDGDPPRAFAALVQFQKQPADDDGSLAAYLVVAHALADLGLPAGVDAQAVWAAL